MQYMYLLPPVPREALSDPAERCGGSLASTTDIAWSSLDFCRNSLMSSASAAVSRYDRVWCQSACRPSIFVIISDVYLSTLIVFSSTWASTFRFSAASFFLISAIWSENQFAEYIKMIFWQILGQLRAWNVVSSTSSFDSTIEGDVISTLIVHC